MFSALFCGLLSPLSQSLNLRSTQIALPHYLDEILNRLTVGIAGKFRPLTRYKVSRWRKNVFSASDYLIVGATA